MTTPCELVLAAAATIGESPTWSASEQALYWIDVKKPALFRYDPSTGQQRRWKVTSDLGAFALESGNAAYVALREGLQKLDLASGRLTPVAPAPYDTDLFRFNEGACDTHGRFWLGVMFDPIRTIHGPPRAGSLHVYDRRHGLRPAPDAAELHNGMAWSPDQTVFYLAHSQQQTIYAFEYDAPAGTLGARRVFAQVAKQDGLPDGAAVDVAGGYWCALHGGSRIRRYHPDGAIDHEIELPVSQPTMCAFGGQALDILYITSATDKLTEAQRAREPLAGGLFSYRPEIPGSPRACLVG